MKKILCILVLILAVACVLSACNQSSSPSVKTTSTTHEETTPESTTPEETTPEEKTKHLWSDWITIKDAKCEEKGLLQRYCTECYYTESKPIDVLGHTEVIDAAVAPTCIQVGFSEGKHCSVCNKVFIAQQSIDAFGHTEVIDAAVAPTCTQVGFSEGKHCSVCNKVWVAQEMIDAIGHNYTFVYDDLTATAVMLTFTCGNCDDTYIESVTPIDFTITRTNRDMIGYTNIAGENIIIPALFENDGIWYKVTTIGSDAFHGCSSLKSVIIPDTVTSIGDSAFFKCTSLKSVIIPDSVTSIGNNAFDGCNSALYTEYELGKYVGNETNPYAVLIAVTNKNMSTYAIHPDTKVIACGAFSGCSRLTSITIPDSVTSIGGGAFRECISLTSVTIPDSVTSIGYCAFEDCSSLTSVTIPDSVTSIGYRAFQYCYSLTSVTIGDSVTSIGSSAFRECTFLTSVTFANPNGWWYAYSANATSGTAIPADSLSNPATAARYLKDTYIYYYWFRTE